MLCKRINCVQLARGLNHLQHKKRQTEKSRLVDPGYDEAFESPRQERNFSEQQEAAAILELQECARYWLAAGIWFAKRSKCFTRYDVLMMVFHFYNAVAHSTCAICNVIAHSAQYAFILIACIAGPLIAMPIYLSQVVKHCTICLAAALWDNLAPRAWDPAHLESGLPGGHGSWPPMEFAHGSD